MMITLEHFINNSADYPTINKELQTLELIYPKIPKGHISYKIKTFFKIKMYKKILLEKTK